MRITKKKNFPEELYHKDYTKYIQKRDEAELLKEIDFETPKLININKSIFKNPMIPGTLTSKTEVKVMDLNKVEYELKELKERGRLRGCPELKELYQKLKGW